MNISCIKRVFCNILRFILPCKSGCQPIFGIEHFVTQFTYFKTNFKVVNRKEKKNIYKKKIV